MKSCLQEMNRFPPMWDLGIEKKILGTVSGYHGVTWGLNAEEHGQAIQKQLQIHAISFGGEVLFWFFFSLGQHQESSVCFIFHIVTTSFLKLWYAFVQIIVENYTAFILSFFPGQVHRHRNSNIYSSLIKIGK